MNELICPYCEAEQHVESEDYEFYVDDGDQWECGACGKTFIAMVEFTAEWDTAKNVEQDDDKEDV